MIMDPKTALDRCETLMLDMDGTILDLAYDTYVWRELVPARFAARHGLSVEAARNDLFTRYRAFQGNLDWYCLDHWSDHLGLDIVQLHRDVTDRIAYLPGAREFLQRIRKRHVRVLLVTNSHPDTLLLKHQATGLGEFFDGLHSSHAYGIAKEQQGFWDALHDDVDFDPETTLFVDDNRQVLHSAAAFGIEMLVEITRPDTSRPARRNPEFAAVEAVFDLL